MTNETLKAFDFPNSLVKAYEHWYVLLRPEQTTLGSLEMICKEPFTSYSDISEEVFKEQQIVIQHIEKVLQGRFRYDKINYLMLMMVDPVVHFHVIPRYEKSVAFCGDRFADSSWPKPPEFNASLNLTEICRAALLSVLKDDFMKVSKRKYRRMYTSGCFDIFHQGHLNILKKTKALCDYLVVGVSTDGLIVREKGRKTVIPFEERFAIVESIKYVDEVIPQIDKNKQRIVNLYKIDAISVGSDWKGRYPEVSCEMVYFEYTPNVSSTILKKKLNLLKK